MRSNLMGALGRLGWLMCAVAIPLACSGTAIVETNEQPLQQGSSKLVCNAPEAIMQHDTNIESGFVRCDSGMVHRVREVICEQPQQPQRFACEDTDAPLESCTVQADCDERPYGRCGRELPWDEACGCTYGCASDADCDSGKICACAGVVGSRSECIPAGCTADDACADGVCGLNVNVGACGTYSGRTACISETAECAGDTDCQPNAELCKIDPDAVACKLKDDTWTCVMAIDCGGLSQCG